MFLDRIYDVNIDVNKETHICSAIRNPLRKALVIISCFETLQKHFKHLRREQCILPIDILGQVSGAEMDLKAEPGGREGGTGAQRSGRAAALRPGANVWPGNENHCAGRQEGLSTR